MDKNGQFVIGVECLTSQHEIGTMANKRATHFQLRPL